LCALEFDKAAERAQPFVETTMKRAKLHLLLLALVIAGIALVSLPIPAAAFFYCWHVDADITCCRTQSGDVICYGG
jgi:hypothetical protein